MPTAPSEQADLALLFDFDGTLYVGDLPILAYARHCAGQLCVVDATALIDNVRFFLEGKSVGDRIIDLGDARDGFEAVEILAAAAGLTAPQIDAAYRAARQDLAGSAFALDAPEGLIALLAWLQPARVVVVTNADRTGVQEVLDAIQIAEHIDQVITDAGKPDAMPEIIGATLRRIVAEHQPQRLIAIGDRWSTDLADAHRLGAVTAMVDRFGRGDGTPTLRSSDLAGLVPEIRKWALTSRGRR